MELIPIKVWGAWAYKCTKLTEDHETLPCDDCKLLGFLNGEYLTPKKQKAVKARLLEYYPDATIVAYGKGLTMDAEDV